MSKRVKVKVKPYNLVRYEGKAHLFPEVFDIDVGDLEQLLKSGMVAKVKDKGGEEVVENKSAVEIKISQPYPPELEKKDEDEAEAEKDRFYKGMMNRGSKKK